MKDMNRLTGHARPVCFVFVLALVFSLLMIPAAAGAQEEKSTTEEILDIMRDQGQITETRYDEMMQKAKAEEVDGTRLKPFWDQGLGFASEDGRFEIEFGGRIMLDWATISADDEFEEDIQAAEEDPLEGDGFEFRRARLFVEGTIYDTIIFKAQYDFAGGDPEFKDVYMGLTGVPAVGTVVVGHFKEPYSLEEQTSSKYITFMQRSLPVNAFSPGRNTGLMMTGSALEDRMTWAVGAFYDTDDFGNSFNDYTDINVSGRVTGTPLYADEGRQAIHLGLSYSHQFRDEEESTVRYRVRPSAHITDARLANTGSMSAEDVDIVNAEAAAVFGPFSVQSEYIQAFVSSEEANDPSFSGYYVYGSFFLTGESRVYKPGSGSFSRVTPNSYFHPTEGGTGAWELALRYASLDLNDEAIEGGELSDITFGVNWYLNPNMRVMFNYVYADLEDRADVTDDSANVFQARFQIDF